jgi:hypothetical protein
MAGIYSITAFKKGRKATAEMRRLDYVTRSAIVGGILLLVVG